jgi:hypothetical protein
MHWCHSVRCFEFLQPSLSSNDSSLMFPFCLLYCFSFYFFPLKREVDKLKMGWLDWRLWRCSIEFAIIKAAAGACIVVLRSQ